MIRRIADEEIHKRISEAIRETGTTSSKYWRLAKERTSSGHSPSWLYQFARNRRVYGVNFFGYGTWHNYLRKHHGIEPTREKKGPKPIADEQIKQLISEAIQKTKATSSKHWQKSTEPIVNGHSLKALYHLAHNRKFFGYKKWDAYLEAEHEVVPLDQGHWSDERLHRTIAMLLKKHPPEEWYESKTKVLYGKTLNSLRNLAHSSNNTYRPRKEKFFDQGTFKRYAEWVLREYGEKHG